MSYNLFLDDDPKRIPHKLSWIDLPLVEWVIVRNYDEFVKTILRDSMPKIISFDHDLSKTAYDEFFRSKEKMEDINYNNIVEKTGFDCAKWVANYCIDKNINLPDYYIHTLNDQGALNIFSILESARKIIELNVTKTKI